MKDSERQENVKGLRDKIDIHCLVNNNQNRCLSSFTFFKTGLKTAI